MLKVINIINHPEWNEQEY